MTRRGLALRLIVAVLVLVAGIAFVFRVFFLRMARVPTGSMLNTIAPGDHLLIHKLLGNINRGDLVMFQYPGDQAYFISRVIGLPGDTIQLKGKIVYVNGHALLEQRVLVEPPHKEDDSLKELSTDGSGPYRVYYVKHPFEEDGLTPEMWGDFGVETPFQIPNDSYFLMGDNRENSYDSRFRGPVPRNLIWGKPSIIYYSERVPGRALTKLQ